MYRWRWQLRACIRYAESLSSISYLRLLIINSQSLFALEMMLGSTMFFAKTCLLLLFYRIFSPNRIFRYKLYGAFAFIATTTLPYIPMFLAICLPGSKGSWAEGQIKCHRTYVYSYVQGPAGVIFDLFVIYLPASVIVHLHMPLRRKIGVLAIFMTGLLWVEPSSMGEWVLLTRRKCRCCKYRRSSISR